LLFFRLFHKIIDLLMAQKTDNFLPIKSENCRKIVNFVRFLEILTEIKIAEKLF